MGLFKDIKKLSDQGKEINKTFDPGAQARSATEQMKAMNQQMAATTAAMNATPMEGGIEANATIVSIGQTAGMMNMDPIMPLELLIQQEGAPPRPMSATVIVPMGQMVRLQAGATLPVRLSSTDATALAVDWAKLG